MKIIVGLGNPGDKYEGTRHNAGFAVLNEVIKTPMLDDIGEIVRFSSDKRFNAELCALKRKGQHVILIKPHTFMNNSGSAVSKVMEYYKADIKDLIVVCDDVDLPLGHLRLRLSGGSAGQKGLQDIIDMLGTNQFVRLRIGIANFEFNEETNQIDTKDFVLQKFSDRDKPVFDNVVKEAAKLLVSCLDEKGETLKATSIELPNSEI